MEYVYVGFRITNDEVFSKGERRKVTFNNFKKLTSFMDRA
jgi:hypothetical protein